MKNHTTTKNLPTLPVDSPEVLKYRGVCQKPRHSEEIWSWFVLRRISIYVTLMLRRTPITPNGISWLGLFFFVLTGWLMVMAEPWAFLLAVLTYNLGYLCDCLDGELARLTGVTSEKGVFLDTLIRAVSIPKVVAFALAAWVLAGEASLSPGVASGIYFAALMGTLALLIPLAYNHIRLKKDENDPVSDLRTSSATYEWIAFLTGMPGFFALLPLCVGVEAFSGLPVTLVWILGFLSMFTVKTLLRLYLTISKLS